MAEKSAASTSAPTNGHSIKNSFNAKSKSAFGDKTKHADIAKAIAQADPKVKKPELTPEKKRWIRATASLPKNLYRFHFGRQSLTLEQKMRQSINTTKQIVPQSVVGLLQRKVKGAITRMEHRKAEIQMCQVALKTGTVVKRGRLVAISPSEKKAYQQRKLQAQADLIAATQDLIVFKTNLIEAVEKNSSPVKDNIKTVREMAYVKRMTPSISKQIIKFVESNTAAREQLIKLNTDTSTEISAKGFLSVVKENSDKTHKLLEAKPKLAMQVRQRVFEQISQTN